MPSPGAEPASVGWLQPQWPAPPNVRTAFTLRAGGVSRAAYAALNVGRHVGDDPQAVTQNRQRIAAALALPGEPHWLTQVHGRDVLRLASDTPPGEATADAVVTRQPGKVCVIQVADCLPVLFAVRDGSGIGAAHAGWRGLAAGVLEHTVAALEVPPAELVAWIGPGIGPAHFEVGPEVREALIVAAGGHAAAAQQAFTVNARGRWQCDLPQLARQRLQALGLGAVHGAQWCTFADAERFFSHRREAPCGRMAALIWLTGPPQTGDRLLYGSRV